jgi:hypothetical protein
MEPLFEEQSAGPGRVRHEIAMRAARLIAEDGLDYAGAKRRAARELLGRDRPGLEHLPDNAMVEAEVRAYQSLYQGDTQPQRLADLRQLALRIMDRFERFSPVLIGAVANGTAGEHSDIHLQLYCDSAKDVEMQLLNDGIDFDVDEERPSKHHGSSEEVIRLLWRERGRAPEGLHLSVYTGDRRGGNSNPEKLTAPQLRRLISEA